MISLVVGGLLVLAWLGVVLVLLRAGARRRRTGQSFFDWLFSRRRPGPHGPWREPGPREKWLPIALVVALVALPIAATAVAWREVACLGGGPDTGITMQGGECVGVTDGTYHFSGDFPDGEIGDATKAAFNRVQDTIKAQNNSLSGPYVKVAMLSPLTSPLSGPRIVHKLLGAAAAQNWVNEPGRGSPRIQLLLAHMGSAEAQWKHVVDQLVDMKDDDEPLVAVIGVGLSQDETRLAADELARAGIPMVADVITASDLGVGGPIDGFHRVSYNNDQQFDTLFGFLRERNVNLDNAVVVRSDDDLDTYSTSAAEAVSARLPRRPVPIEFGGTDPGKLANQFKGIAWSLCGSRDAVVFYAGRSRYLSNLLQKLHAEGCLNSALVISASDAAVLRMRTTDDTVIRNWGVREAVDVVRNGKVSLYFTPLADPPSLDGRAPYEEFEKAFTAVGGTPDDLRTGWAVMAWDSLRVTAEWVWMAQTAAEPGLPRARDVSRASTLKFTSETYPYDGASGRFWFRDGDRRGDAPRVVQLVDTP